MDKRTEIKATQSIRAHHNKQHSIHYTHSVHYTVYMYSITQYTFHNTLYSELQDFS